jgi:hypothetical protein
MSRVLVILLPTPMAKRRLTTAQAAHLEDMSAQRAAKKRCLVNKQPIEVELDTGVSPEIQTIRQRFEQKEAVRQAKNLKVEITASSCLDLMLSSASGTNQTPGTRGRAGRDGQEP